MNAAETIAAAVQKLESLRDEATGGPWFYNSYGAVFGKDAKHEEHFDDWLERTDKEGHTHEHRGRCPACGSDFCALSRELYDRDTCVASVPAAYGDTAIRGHRADAQLIELLHRTINAQLAILRDAMKSLTNLTYMAEFAEFAEKTFRHELLIARAILGGAA